MLKWKHGHPRSNWIDDGDKLTESSRPRGCGMTQGWKKEVAGENCHRKSNTYNIFNEN
jgi:hypothetical protein